MSRRKALSFVAAGIILGSLFGAVAIGSPVVQAAVRAALVRDADNPARQPVFLEGRYSAEPGDYYVTGEYAIDYTVPEGKRLVVEFISASAADTPESPETHYEARIGLPGGVSALDAFYLGMVPLAGGYRVAQPLRLYYGPGDHFRVATARFECGAAGRGNAQAVATGYLVDLQ